MAELVDAPNRQFGVLRGRVGSNPTGPTKHHDKERDAYASLSFAEPSIYTE